MLILIGAYRLWPKIVGYRKDFCLNCEVECVARQIRGFYVSHVFFIPILPLGFWKNWHCEFWNNSPRERSKTRRSFKYLGLVATLIISLAFWLMPIGKDEKLEDVTWFWILRFLFPAFFVGLMVSLKNDVGDVNLRDKLALLTPFESNLCLFCDGVLSERPIRSCSSCGVRRFDPVT